MTEPRKPDDESPKPEDPHGLVEDIQHEIEEVVGHVPRPIRWTVGKLVRLAALVLAGLVSLVLLTAVLYVINRTEWAAGELSLIVNQALASRSDVTIELGDVKGNPFTGLRVLRPRIQFREGDQPPLLTAPEMRLRYSAWALVTGGSGSIVVEIDHPVIRLGRSADGKLRLPSWKPSPVRGRARGLEFALRVRDGELFTPDTVARIGGLDLDARAATGPQTRFEVRSLRWARGPFGSVLERCALEVASSDSVRVQVKELRTPDVVLRGRAAWVAGAGEAILHLDVDRVRWRWLHRVTGRHDLDVPGEARLVVEARGGRAMSGRFEARGVWDSLAADAQGGFVWRPGRLRVEPLVAHSLAGDLDGEVTWSGKSWEITAELRRGDPSRWSIIGLRDWPAGDLNGRFRYAVETHRLKSARLDARLAPSEWTGWRADSGTVDVDFTPVGPDSFRVRALRRGGEMTLKALTDSTGWSGDYALERYPLDEWPDGRASGIRGTLASGRGMAQSHRGHLRVTGALEGAVTDWLGIHTARWRMSEMRGALLPLPDLEADVRLEDLVFLTVHWDSVTVPIHVGGGTVRLPRLRAFAGDTVLSLSSRADWDAQGWRMTSDSASVRSGQFHWTAEPPMRLSGDRHGVGFDRLVATDGDSRLTMEGRWAGVGGAFDWVARAERLDLGRLGFPPAWELTGSAGAELRVTGSAGDPRWDLRARASRPGARGQRVDSLRLEIDGGPSRLEVRDARAMLDGGMLSLTGEVTDVARAWPDTLTGDGVARWIADASQWHGLVRAERLPLERLVNAAAPDRGLTGRGSGALEIDGRPLAPNLTWNLEAAPAAWGDYRLDGAVAQGHYRDGRLEVSQLRMTRGSVVSTITGSMPLRLAVGRRPELPEEPMEWQVNLPSGDLSVVPLFVPQIGSAAGRFDVAARLGGTVRHPNLSGTARIREGRARMAGREEELEGVSADLTFDETRITLDTLSARQRKRRGAPGIVTGGGVVELTGLALKGYRINLHMHDFTALESGVYVALFDGEFVVTNGPKVGGATLPLVEGDVELRRAVVLFDFANQSQVAQIASATQPLYWLYRIQLSATDNLRWQPSGADIEFSADLRLEQTPDSLLIYGDMTALRGTYYYLSSRFAMDRVNLTFDNVGGVNPRLDVVATTRVPLAAGEEPPSGPSLGSGTGTGNVNITVTITGRAAEPVMAFGSDRADWDQSTILRSLTVGPWLGEQKNRSRAGQALADDWVTRNLNRQLSADLSHLFQGYLGDWELARESGGLFVGQGEVIVGVNTQLTRNLNLRYRQRVPGFARQTATTTPTQDPFERDVEAEYRINRFFFISSEVTKRRALTSNAATAPEFNVSLKARWEY